MQHLDENKGVDLLRKQQLYEDQYRQQKKLLPQLACDVLKDKT